MLYSTLMKMTQEQRKILLISTLGGALEFYDFIIFALLATPISQQFFPIHQPLISLMATFAIFATGYFVRPLGGIVFGHFGDLVSRTKTFSSSILVMALATLGIGLLPTYHAIGFFAPVLLTLLRILQGFSVGGEIPGAFTYISEIIPERRGFACGVIPAGLTMGAIVGSITIALLQASFSPTSMHEWGWRIPFILGGVFGLLSFKMRKQIKESALFSALKLKQDHFPLRIILKSYKREVLYGFSLMALAATLASLLSTYIPAYLNQVIQYKPAHFMWVYAFMMGVISILNIVFGYLCDRMSSQHLLGLLFALSLTVSYPAYFIYTHYPQYYFIALLISAPAIALAFSLVPYLLTGLFPTEIRYSAVALSYSAAYGIFGGMTPLLATYFITFTHQALAPSGLIMGVALLSIVGVSLANLSSAANKVFV